MVHFGLACWTLIYFTAGLQNAVSFQSHVLLSQGFLSNLLLKLKTLEFLLMPFSDAIYALFTFHVKLEYVKLSRFSGTYMYM